VIGKFADSWGFGLMVAIEKMINFGLMIRDTTTYNVWNINEKQHW
jgi:hypothetical protein